MPSMYRVTTKSQIGKLPKGASFEVVVDSIWKGPSREDIEKAIKLRYGIDIHIGMTDWPWLEIKQI